MKQGYELNFRGDFIDKNSRDSARLALHDQVVMWDGSAKGGT